MAVLMHRLLIAGLFAAGCNAHRTSLRLGSGVNQSFAQYMADFGKSYAMGSAEHRMREGLFNQRATKVLSHNAAGLSWEMELNHFSDWTEAELQSLRGYKRAHTGYSMPSASSFVQEAVEPANGPAIDEKPATDAEPSGSTDTESMDWSSSLATSQDVLNQGGCGSCWAVAAAAAIQLHAAKAYPGFNKILSPQNINQCAPNPMHCGGDGGCQGSTPALAFEYVKTLGERGGLYTMDKLPYTASSEGKIPMDSCSSKTGALSFLQMKTPGAVVPSVSIAGWTKVEENHAEKVMDALVTKGPLSVAIVGSGIQAYSKGVISTCSSNVVDHAVVMMGFGKDPEHNMLYWNIRNSWGKAWGENGFFRLQRHYAKGAKASTSGTGEPCGWDNDPAKGVACQNDKGEYPKKTYVCGECGIISDVTYPTGVKVHPGLLA